MKIYYVYVYLDPRKSPPEPVYVGKGHGKRYLDHVNNGATNMHLANKIDKIREENLEPIVEFVRAEMFNEEAMQLEVDLIKKYGRADKGLGTLCNWTDGGEGTDGYKHRESTLLLFSEQRKGKKQTDKQYKANCNRIVSDETKQKISVANKGHCRCTIKQIESLREYNRKREITDYMRKKWSKTRLGNTPTKANYPSDAELLLMISRSSRNQVAKQLGIGFTSLNNYLRRRGLFVEDARFK